MFPSLEHPDRHRSRAVDAGFTLIEVMVALGILVLVTAAIYPQIVVGLRATGTARDITQAKGVAQSKLEQMRAMPFYVGREAGDYIDILDTYYRNTVAPAAGVNCATVPLTTLPPTTWTGYVNTAATHCAWEPSGPLYRKVINPISSPGLGAFAMVVSTQFLSGATPPTAVAPLAGYNSQTSGSDQPSANQVGVTVAVLYRTQSGVKYASTYTQIERSAAMDPLIQSRAKATTVHVSSSARTWGDWTSTSTDPADTGNDQVNLLDDIGIINLTGELFTGSRVVANASGAAAATSLPSAVSGALTNLVAPGDQPVTGTNSPDVSLPNGCQWICFGSTQTDQVSAYSSNGLPNAGTSDSPVRAMIPSGAGRDGFWFDNGKWRNRLRLADDEPMVSVDTSATNTIPGVRGCVVDGPGSTTNSAILAATGFLTATAATSADPEVAACGTAQANTLRIFPTNFAPDGVVRVTLTRASAYCRVRTASGNTAAGDYLATVRYWNGSGYSLAGTVSPANSTDPLGSVNLSQVIDSASGLRLSDYIASWGSLTGDKVVTQNSTRSVSVDVPAPVTILTNTTRSFDSGWGTDHTDPTSAISIAVGAVSCSAGDYR